MSVSFAAFNLCFAITHSADTSMLNEPAQAFFVRGSRSLLHLCWINACTTISGETGGLLAPLQPAMRWIVGLEAGIRH